MSELSKENKFITVKMLKNYLENYPDQITVKIYIKVLENFEDDELVPDLILRNLGLSEEDFK
ncbi:MAG TPA: hypothetical protein EYH43_03490 [Persephonella sp.]|nr:hypothetical protein [Hydrogenothermaceae bacterium]HIQ25026.1 hypothetical protein [Persephonella sp.]